VQEDIVLSWRNTCLLRELFGEHLEGETVFDQAVNLAAIEAETDLAALDEFSSASEQEEAEEEEADNVADNVAEEEAAPAVEDESQEEPQEEPPAGSRRGRPLDPNSKRAQKEAAKAAAAERARREQPRIDFFLGKTKAPES
jgi:hypothetical protein